MPNLARSCLRMLLVYATVAAVLAFAIHHRYPNVPAAIWSGLIGGFFVWLALAYLWVIPTNLRDWWRMRDGAPLHDETRVAVIGTIHAAGASLHAPFSRTPCVAYQYKVISLKGQHPSNDYEGFAMVPSFISTAEGAQVRMLAYPELDLPDEPVRGKEAKEQAREFLASTSFLDIRKGGVRAAANELKNLLADDDGTIRYDHRMEPVAESLDDCRLLERVVKAGETVCVLGRYSEARRALVPDPGAVVHAATLRVGTRESFRRRALRKTFGSAIGVLVCGGLVTAAAVIFLLNLPLDLAEQMNPKRRFLWEEVKLERWLHEKIRRPFLGSGGQAMYFVSLCEGCATGRLEANGRAIELRHASGWQNATERVVHLSSAAGERDGITITQERGRDSSIRIGVTMNGRTFPVPAAWLMPRDWQTSLGEDETLSGRVTVMAPNDSIRARASFRAPLETR